MSTPEGTGGSRSLRTGGLTLLVLAAVAALIGLAVVVTGGEPNPASQRPASPSLPAGNEPTTSASLVPPAPIPPLTSTPTTIPAPAPAAPGLPGTPAPDPAAPDPAASEPGGKLLGGTPNLRGQARVYNNSTIRGLAARAADDLNAAGWTVIEVANYSGGRIPTSTVYYREGTDERATAEAIGAEFGIRVEPRFDGIADASPGVIVIVTNDYGS